METTITAAMTLVPDIRNGLAELQPQDSQETGKRKEGRDQKDPLAAAATMDARKP